MILKLFSTSIALLFFCISFSQSLTFDANFGTAGKVVTSLGSEDSLMASLAVQSDGKIIACGSYYNGVINQMALSRYTYQGIIDSTFGTNGIVLTPLGTELENEYNAVQVLNSGKILVAGSNGTSTSGYDFVIVRYNSNGTLDTSFGTNGILISDFNSESNKATSLQIQSDNKFIIGGTINGNSVSGYPNFSIARYNENGTKDTMFGVDGLASINFGTLSNNLLLSEDVLRSIKIQTDGKIVATGFTFYSTSNGGSNFGTIRLNANGSLDTNFGTNGRLITDFGAGETGTSLQLLSSGEIIVSGTYFFNADNNQKAVVVKYNANGSLDTSFGTGGKITTDFNNVQQKGFIFSSEMTLNNQLQLTGFVNNATADFILLQYNSNGILDSNFGDNGIQTIDFGFSEGAFTSITQSNGQLILGGGTFNGSTVDFTLLRFNQPDLENNVFIAQQNQFSISPNPFQTELNLKYTLQKKEFFAIDLFDCNGRIIKNIVNKQLFENGNHTLQIVLPESLSKGVYFLKTYNEATSSTLRIVK